MAKARNEGTCGHENKHYIPPEKLKGEKLFCTLDAGHAGDHQCPYKLLQDGKLVPGMAYWSDAVDDEPMKPPPPSAGPVLTELPPELQ